MAQIISNQAIISYSTEGSEERINATSNVANTTLLDAYGIEVSKQSLQQYFNPGENITYTIRVTNNGYKKLNNFKITDTVGGEGSNLTYMQYTARVSIGGEFIMINPTALNPLTFTIPNTLLAYESFTLTYVVTVSANLDSSILQIENTATVTARSASDPEDPTEYSATDSATILRDMSANLVITKSASKPTIMNNDSYEYILSIENVGMSNATNVVITDELPKGFTVTSIRVENENFVHDYDPSEYVVNEENLLTLPSESGTAINVLAKQKSVDQGTTIFIYGNFNTPTD